MSADRSKKSARHRIKLCKWHQPLGISLMDVTHFIPWIHCPMLKGYEWELWVGINV
jgi:hypothetical protein